MASLDVLWRTSAHRNQHSQTMPMAHCSRPTTPFPDYDEVPIVLVDPATPTSIGPPFSAPPVPCNSINSSTIFCFPPAAGTIQPPPLSDYVRAHFVQYQSDTDMAFLERESSSLFLDSPAVPRSISLETLGLLNHDCNSSCHQSTSIKLLANGGTSAPPRLTEPSLLDNASYIGSSSSSGTFSELALRQQQQRSPKRALIWLLFAVIILLSSYEIVRDQDSLILGTAGQIAAALGRLFTSHQGLALCLLYFGTILAIFLCAHLKLDSCAQ